MKSVSRGLGSLSRLVASLPLVLCLAGATALPSCRPEPATGQAEFNTTSVTPDDLWQQLAEFRMQPNMNSWMAKLRIADVPRKSWDLGRRACERPRHHALLDEHGASVKSLDFGEGERPFLFIAPQQDRPSIILVHGLFDSKYARYLDRTGEVLAERGFGVLVPDMRWHGCRYDDSPPSLGPREAEDLIILAHWVQERYPSSSVGLVGFSLGSLIVSHALGHDEANEAFASGGIAFSPPGNLEYTLDWLDRRPSDSYSRVFRSWIRQRLRREAVSWRRGDEFQSALEWLATQSREDRTDFVARRDLAGVLPRVLRPLQMYTSADDPYFTQAAGEYLQDIARSTDCVNVQETPFGGHIAHIAVDSEWFARSVLTFFEVSATVRCGGLRV